MTVAIIHVAREHYDNPQPVRYTIACSSLEQLLEEEARLFHEDETGNTCFSTTWDIEFLNEETEARYYDDETE